MAGSYASTVLLGALTLSTVLTPAGAARAATAPKPHALHTAPGVPITLDAQSFDGTNTTLVFRKVRISQGTMSIAAELGQGQGQGQGSKPAAGPDFDDSLWTFRGNVKITMDRGVLTADDAEINFVNQQLSRAVANGKPAVFEDLLQKTGKVAHGHADTIDYDAVNGIVRLRKNAWLSNGDTEIRGDSLKYNTIAQIFNSEGPDQDSQRVHIIITPPAPKP